MDLAARGPELACDCRLPPPPPPCRSPARSRSNTKTCAACRCRTDMPTARSQSPTSASSEFNLGAAVLLATFLMLLWLQALVFRKTHWGRRRCIFAVGYDCQQAESNSLPPPQGWSQSRGARRSSLAMAASRAMRGTLGTSGRMAHAAAMAGATPRHEPLREKGGRRPTLAGPEGGSAGSTRDPHKQRPH